MGRDEIELCIMEFIDSFLNEGLDDNRITVNQLMKEEERCRKKALTIRWKSKTNWYYRAPKSMGIRKVAKKYKSKAASELLPKIGLDFRKVDFFSTTIFLRESGDFVVTTCLKDVADNVYESYRLLNG